MFTYPMEVKSVITRPRARLQTMTGPGLYELSGIAWSGAGTIRKRRGLGRRRADLGAKPRCRRPCCAYALTRFRIAWKWNGAPTRAARAARRTTPARVQPTRDELIAAHGSNVIFHYNAIQAWSVRASGEVKNVYA